MKSKESEAEQMAKNKTKVDSFALLPDDLLVDILQKLPCDVLRHKTRFVCKRWFSLTTNRILLDHAFFLLQSEPGSRRTVRLMATTLRLMATSEEKQGLEMKKQRHLEIPHGDRIKSWCNEFLLITCLKKYNLKKYNRFLYIYDLVTKQGSFLPPCSTDCQWHNGPICRVGISYDKFKGVYKVVHVFLGPNTLQCELLVLKSNITSYNSLRWKKINVPHYTSDNSFYWGDMVSVQGRYFHLDVRSYKYIVSMDTVKERFCQTRLPGSDMFAAHKGYTILEMGGFLTLLNKGSEDKVNIWRLKGVARTNWEKLMSITISSDVWSGAIRFISKRYIIFESLRRREAGLYSYDLKSKMIKRLKVDYKFRESCVVQTTSRVPFWIE